MVREWKTSNETKERRGKNILVILPTHIETMFEIFLELILYSNILNVAFSLSQGIMKYF